MSWQLITSDRQLRDKLTEYAGASVVAIDTEFMRQDTFFPKPALIQLCFDDLALLVDPLVVTDSEPLKQLLQNPSVVKVIHSASEDLEVFKCWPGALPQPLFDSQRAAGLLNFGFSLGYRALVSQLLGIELPKGETRSNWLARPLSSAQCEYAAQDVIYLRQLYDLLSKPLADSQKLDWVLAEGEEVINTANMAPDYSQRVKSAWKLMPRQLVALRGLVEWREQRAKNIDKPRNWVLDDKTLFALASAMPANIDELVGLGVLGDKVLRRLGEDLLVVVKQARETPGSALPDRLPGPLSANQRSQVKRLRALVVERAKELEVAPECLAQNRDLEALVRHADGEAIHEPPAWSGWRRRVIIEPLRDRLSEGVL